MLFQCIEKLGKGCLSAENMNLLMTLIERYMKKHFSKQEERHGEFDDSYTMYTY